MTIITLKDGSEIQLINVVPANAAQQRRINELVDAVAGCLASQSITPDDEEAVIAALSQCAAVNLVISIYLQHKDAVIAAAIAFRVAA